MTESEAIAMEKTNDEKRLACLNEIHRIIPGGQGQAMAGANIVVSVEEFTIQFLSCGQHIWEICTTDTYSDWSLAYRLFGLESREARERLALLQSDLAYANKALDMANDVALGLTDGCLTDKVRASKLVAALEKIANDGFEDDSEYHTGYLDAYCELKWVAEAALAEWKGGAGE